MEGGREVGEGIVDVSKEMALNRWDGFTNKR